MLVKKFLFTYRTNGTTIVATSVFPIQVARAEDHAPRVGCIVRVERTRRIEAAARKAQVIVVARARRREKDGVTVGFARYDSSCYAYTIIVACPSPSAVIY